KIIRVNKAFADFVKLKPEEIIGRHCYELIHGEKEASQYCSHKEALITRKPSYKEFYNPHLGIYMEVVCSPIFNEKGEITTTVHIGRDITERKRMEAQMMVTDRLASIGELASGVAHELNNPLTGIIGFSELLLDKEVPADIREDLMVINREAKRTAQVVRNLLIFARKHPEEKQDVNINSAINIVLELRTYEQKVNNIQVITRFAADLPQITADSFQLQQVFLNIITNAEYFMIGAHQGGMLTITTKQVGDFLRISFADDGPGIAPENLGHLFDPFFTTKEVGKGTGLGLSICHGTITKYGGRIYAESELGKGATFIVELPITKQ
ncbi:MAG: PAS domain-containing protein, partial [Chloroflexi bacterium]|nr:PAS domain-containing protein [Chloroflexota bacterium]